MHAILSIIILLLLTGCSTIDVDENRAGCTFIDGSARYGSLTQYVKGAGQGVYVYIGGKLLDKGLEISCSETEQLIKLNNTIEKPAWSELENEVVYFE